ncbi:MAG: class E sortase [Stackebrandtia sp.]
MRRDRGFDRDDDRFGRRGGDDRDDRDNPRRDRHGSSGDARGVARVPPKGTGRPVPDPEEPSGADPLGLIPGPDETTILPRMPRRSEPPRESREVPSFRRRRSIKRHRDAGAPSPASRLARGGAETAVTFGAVVLLFLGWTYWHNNSQSEAAQSDLNDQVEEDWAEDDALDPLPGESVARLYMPQIRPEPWVVVEGTTLEDIEYAPGRYEDGAMPGEKGNFAMAGHNVPAIFRHIDELGAGDEIVVETPEKFYIYEITGDEIIEPTEVDVVAPVPREPGVEPGDDDRYLTMTTCYPWWDNYQRYVVYGKLVDEQKRGDELPAEAQG